MDMELNLDTDGISTFLNKKLHDTQMTNVQLEKSLSYRKEWLLRCCQGAKTDCKVRIADAWKRIINGKYVLGFAVQNETDVPLILTNTILIWDSSAQLPLKYKVSLMLPERLQRTDRLNSSGYVLIIVDVPPFIDQLAYTISGALIFDKNNTTVNLPCLKITTEDVADNQLSVPALKVIEGEIESLLSYAVSNEKFELVMVLPPNWSRALESILEIDCRLSRINLQTPTLPAKSHYISQNLNEGALLEVERAENMIYHLNIYCRNEDGLASFMHFLHSRLRGVSIVPKAYYLNQYKLHEATDTSAGQFRKCLKKEFSYLIKSVANITNATVRCKLADLEHSTDTLFGKVKFGEEENMMSFDLS